MEVIDNKQDNVVIQHVASGCGVGAVGEAYGVINGVECRVQVQAR